MRRSFVEQLAEGVILLNWIMRCLQLHDPNDNAKAILQPSPSCPAKNKLNFQFRSPLSFRRMLKTKKQFAIPVLRDNAPFGHDSAP